MRSPSRILTPIGTDLSDVLRSGLRTVAMRVAAPRAVLVWEDAEEPWVEVAEWDGTGLTMRREPPDDAAAMVADELLDVDFHVTDGTSAPATVTCTPRGERRTCAAAPLAGDFAERHHLRDVLSVRVRGELATGRLFLSCGAATTAAQLDAAVAGGAQLAEAIDRFLVTRNMRSVATIEERERLSHELHDGVLQSLTGIAFRLKSVEALLATDTEAARLALVEVQRMLLEEQREVRMFVLGLRSLDSAEPRGTFRQRIEQLLRRVESVWGVTVSATIGFDDVELSPARGHEVLRIIQEAIVNSTRHGDAKVVRVAVGRRGDDALTLSLTDDGRGFSFQGTYDAAALQEARIGPVTLKARAKALGAGLVIHSGPNGARIEIDVPLRAEDVRA
jgi:signal transduction histidine kinase